MFVSKCWGNKLKTNNSGNRPKKLAHGKRFPRRRKRFCNISTWDKVHHWGDKPKSESEGGVGEEANGSNHLQEEGRHPLLSQNYVYMVFNKFKKKKVIFEIPVKRKMLNVSKPTRRRSTTTPKLKQISWPWRVCGWTPFVVVEYLSEKKKDKSKELKRTIAIKIFIFKRKRKKSIKTKKN